MILSFELQLKIFILSIIIGIISGFFYDIIRIFRSFVFHIKVFVHIEDIIYWIFLSLIIFLILLYENNADIRLFFVIGVFLGMWLYFYIVSKPFLKLSIKIINILKIFIKFIIECTTAPIKLLLKLIYIPFKPIIKFLKKNVNKLYLKLKKMLQKNEKCVTIYNKVKNMKKKFNKFFKNNSNQMKNF